MGRPLACRAVAMSTAVNFGGTTAPALRAVSPRRLRVVPARRAATAQLIIPLSVRLSAVVRKTSLTDDGQRELLKCIFAVQRQFGW